MGPAEPVVCAPAPDPEGLPPAPVPLAAAEPDGLEALPECVAADADDADADFEADADVTLATEEEPDTLTTAEPPLMEPAVPDMSP